MRDREGYRDTLERLRQLNDDKLGGKLVMTRKEAASICGVSTDMIYTLFAGEKFLTCEKLARRFCQ